jgi:peptide-methionine (S)-S-oxide reductase
MERIAQMAAAERASDPTAPAGEGDPTGSAHGDTTDPSQEAAVQSSLAMYQERLRAARYGDITTEVKPLTEFFYAEPYHQQYLAKNPNGYCGIGGTGVSCPIGVQA